MLIKFNKYPRKRQTRFGKKVRVRLLLVLAIILVSVSLFLSFVLQPSSFVKNQDTQIQMQFQELDE